MRNISIREAKNNFSQLVTLAEEGEPQIITENGKAAVVVMSYREYARLTAEKNGIALTAYDEEFAEQMAVAKKVMSDNRDLLRKLAE